MTNFPLSHYRGYVRRKGILQDDVVFKAEPVTLYGRMDVLAPEGAWPSKLARLHFEFLFLFTALGFCSLQTLGDFPLRSQPHNHVHVTPACSDVIFQHSFLYYIPSPFFTVPAVIFFYFIYRMIFKLSNEVVMNLD